MVFREPSFCCVHFTSDTLFLSVFYSYLDDTMTYLLGCVNKRDRERSASFQAIGLLAVSVQSDINKHRFRILEVIKVSLPAKDTPQRQVGAGDGTPVKEDQRTMKLGEILVLQKVGHLISGRGT